MITSCSVPARPVIPENASISVPPVPTNGLPEPTFQLGRRDEETGRVAMLEDDQFVFTELPRSAEFQVLDYAQGRYVAKGRRQGVWTAKAPIPLRD